jgi:hypothetical protein
MLQLKRAVVFVSIAICVLFNIPSGSVITPNLQSDQQTQPMQEEEPESPIQTEPVQESESFSSVPQPVLEIPEEPEYIPNEKDVEMLAQVVWGEARGIADKTQQACVIWCVLNRVDHPEYPNTIEEVLTQPNQFHGYHTSFPVTEELKELARDVLIRWSREKNGETDVGRCLPKEYLFFTGDGHQNYFRDGNGNIYTYHLPTPY